MRIDLNADLGESFGAWVIGDDAAMLDVVTSANVACGFHAGDPTTLRRTCAAAVDRGIAIGAQVSYRDLAGFGRRFIEVEPEDLYADVVYQLGALDGIARAMGGRVAYVKPHGALYNAVVLHEAQAEAIVEAVRGYDPGLHLRGLPGSALLRLAAEAGLVTVGEAFADRGYLPDGQLVPRGQAGAVLQDVAAVAERVVRLVTQGRVTAVDGADIALAAESVCIHGDTPGAVEMGRAVRQALEGAGVEVVPLAGQR
jgi:UPF0271 protein